MFLLTFSSLPLLIHKIWAFLKFVSCKYLLKLADFNTEISEVCLKYSLYQHELKNLVKEKTYLKTFRISTAQIFSWQIFYPINILKQFQKFIAFSWVRLGYLKTIWNLEKQTNYKNFGSDSKNAYSILTSIQKQ